MSLRDRYLRILSGIAPAGAGVVLLLGSVMPSAAAPRDAKPWAADGTGVSERLAAIREAVTDVVNGDSRTARSEDREFQLAWGNWWRNW